MFFLKRQSRIIPELPVIIISDFNMRSKEDSEESLRIPFEFISLINLLLFAPVG